MEKNRITGLDQLRGICASSIMLMHFMSILNYKHDAGTFLGRIGFYGVCIFYILSGLTLYEVYRKQIEVGIFSLKAFYIKRFFRIYPLLWVVIGFHFGITLLFANVVIPLQRVLLNLTGLFGFVAWDSYIGMGYGRLGMNLFSTLSSQSFFIQ